MDLVLLFELFLIGKRKTDQPNCYIFNKYCNWCEINQSNCTIMVEVGTVFACRYRRQEHSEGVRVTFGEYSRRC